MTQPEAAPFTERTPRVAAARKLLRRRYRDQQRQFLVEGPQAVREALRLSDLSYSDTDAASTPGVSAMFVTPEAAERHAELIATARSRGLALHSVSVAALASLTETATPQGLVAVCSFIDTSLSVVLARSPRLVAVLEQARDPGNAGTIMRAADAAGADAVIFTDSSVDPYNGKTVRASAGSLFHPAIVRGGSIDQIVLALRASGLRILSTSAAAENDLFALADSGALAAPTAWLFGNEARGVSPAAATLTDEQVAIPIYGQAESLNLATAAGLCLYTSARAQH